jgi:hypothetical protein
MRCYKIENLKGVIHYTDQETEKDRFLEKYGCVKLSIVNYDLANQREVPHETNDPK